MKEADTEGTFGQASGLHEYELTMDVSKKVRAELEDRGYEVKLTHFDTFNPISCTERAAVANENEADAFIRIHANGSENTSSNGAMTICITKDNPYHPELYSASARLSQILLDTYCEQTGAKKEYVRETDSMTGNNWAEVPTTLIELGYMTNPDEDLKMNQDSYQITMANAIADALDLWFATMPESELSMHPSLQEAQSSSADTSSTAEAADAGKTDGGSADTSSTAETAGSGETGSSSADTFSTAGQADTGKTDDGSPDDSSSAQTGGSEETGSGSADTDSQAR
jgi:N-acetylmuramoyl-L-alanine amidase